MELANITHHFGLEFEIFSDDPLPSFENQAKLFNRALLVVGPHGAGMSNLLFSKPGTFVIEVLCSPQPVMCFTWLHHVLGHRYHGILADEHDGHNDEVSSSRSSCNKNGIGNFNVSELLHVARGFLQIATGFTFP